MMHYLLILLIGYLLDCSNMAVYLAAGAQIDVLCGGEVNRHVRAAEQIADQQDQ